MVEAILRKIKLGQGPFWSRIRTLALFILHFNLPTIKIIHLPLYHLQYFVKMLIGTILMKLWYVPLFKARCHKVGKNLTLPNGIPLVVGHLKLCLGNNVTIYRSTLGSTKVAGEPTLILGDNVSIGYGSVISVGKKVKLGDHVITAPYCFISDNDGHPIDPEKRKKGLPVEDSEIQGVEIESNVWIGNNCTILKGVKIGENSIIGANSVVTKSIPPNSIAVGVSARVVKTISNSQ